MGLDIRIPVGALFSLLGALLAGYGLIGAEALARRSLGINIDLWWGLVLAVFGASMLLLAWRARRRRRAELPAQSAVGVAAQTARYRERRLHGPRRRGSPEDLLREVAAAGVTRRRRSATERATPQLDSRERPRLAGAPRASPPWLQFRRPRARAAAIIASRGVRL